ncbi:MAG: VC0807 family protein [Polyangiaceae bacterium]
MSEPPKASPKSGSGAVRIARFAIESFGPLIAFYVFEHWYGLVAAIISGIVSGALLITLQIVSERKVSPFTGFIAVSVVVFGAIDLKYRTGFAVKIEPALGNTITGIFFIATALLGRPLVNELMEKQLGRPLNPQLVPYFRNYSIAMGLYFFARAGLYVWMAYHLTLDQVLVVRGILPVSIIPLILGEMVARHFTFGRKRFRELLHEGDDESSGNVASVG